MGADGEVGEGFEIGMNGEVHLANALLEFGGAAEFLEPASGETIFGEDDLAEDSDAGTLGQEVQDAQEITAEALMLEVVNDGERGFGDMGFGFGADVTGDADGGLGGLGEVEGDPSDVMALVNFGEVTQLLTGQCGRRDEEAEIARFG